MLLVTILCMLPFRATSPVLVREKQAPKPKVLASKVRVDCASIPCLAITFDDGPYPETTPYVLDILQRHHVQATFFVVGKRVPGQERLLQRMQAEGHEIGNHSWGHPNFTKLPPEEIEAQIERAQAAISAAGVPIPDLFRPPYGAIDATVQAHIDMTIIAWNIDPTDWRADSPGQVAERVITHAKPGGIITMHDTEWMAVDSLDAILTSLEPQYRFVTVSDLLDISPRQPGVFYGR